ncbi:MAG TPA: hypothetical protein VJY85_07010 [Candidatus Limnocylindria bacterium]|nr:hypothetical protein [Candidatus Limnocylindria bacterium]
MTPWLLITVLLALLNLAAFLVVRGRWGRVVGLLALASLLGTIAGDAVGDATGLDILVLGDYHVLAACIGAQVLMLGTLLLMAMLPTADERADSESMDR